jgi:hypothetical protein
MRQKAITGVAPLIMMSKEPKLKIQLMLIIGQAFMPLTALPTCKDFGDVGDKSITFYFS